MKDPSGLIRTWLFGALNTKVSYNSVVVPVYSFAPKDAAMPYILLAGFSSPGEDGTKDCYISKHQVTVEIYTSNTGNNATFVPLDAISDSVLQLLRIRTKVNIGTGYNVVSCVNDGIITDSTSDETNIIMIKILNFTLTIAEE
jgi:hypothetical protein